ncbi:MAG: hypothetical protein KC912_18645 [Proteobacteria bacterium]|nr:hypothetical protein [Pseudomonadota bacterium]
MAALPRLTTRLATLILLLVPLALLGPGLMPGKVLADYGTENVYPYRPHTSDEGREDLSMVNADIIRENLVYRHVVRDSLLEGEIPWWSPTMYGGTPFVGLSHTQVFYPLTWLTLPLKPAAAHNWLLLFHLWIAGGGAFAWFRAAGRSREAALFGALTFVLNGMFATRQGHPQFVHVAAWLPWMLFAVEHIFGSKRFLAAAGLAACTTMMILAGHPSVYVFGSYFIGVYLLGRAWLEGPERRKQAVGGLALFGTGYAIGVGLAAVQFLAVLEYSSFSERAQRSVAILTRRQNHWIHALRIMFPNISGTMIDGTYWTPRFTPYWAGTMYNGVTPLLVALYGVIRAPKQGRWMLALVLSIGAVLYSPWVFSLAYNLPGFNFSRIDRFSIAYFLGIAWMSAFGMEQLLKSGAPYRKLTLGLAGVSLAFGGISIYVVNGLSRRVPIARSWSLGIATEAVIWGTALTLLTLALFAYRDRISKRAFYGLAIVLCAIDLGGWWRELTVVRDADAMFPETETTTFLQEEDSTFRIAKFCQEPPGGKGLFAVFPSNTPTIYGIHDLHGFGPLHFQHLDNLLMEAEPGRRRHGWHLKPFKKVAALRSPILDMMNVKFILSRQPLSNLKLVHHGELYVYHNEDAFERVWFAREWVEGGDATRAAALVATGLVDPANRVLMMDTDIDQPKTLPNTGETTASLSMHSANAMSFEKNGPDAGWVVVAENWFPGWEAFIDGAPAEIKKVNVLQRAVFVEEGDHQIEMIYRPTYLRKGKIIMSTALALLFGLLGLHGFFRRRDS